jgi:hypothetical protein
MYKGFSLQHVYARACGMRELLCGFALNGGLLVPSCIVSHACERDVIYIYIYIYIYRVIYVHVLCIYIYIYIYIYIVSYICECIVNMCCIYI